MSIEVCVLASGSSGNCTIVRTPAGVVLVDAGLGPRTAARRMDGTGVALRDVRAICVTHLDSDHFRPSWLGTILNHDIRVFCHRSRIADVLERLDHEAAEPLVQGFDDEAFEPVPGLSTRAIPLAHDRTGSHGFRFDGFGCRAGYASDLGCVPRELLEFFCDVDLLALESNYDADMQLGSARPWFLKNRIMGGAGHLSNEQAFETIRRILDRCQRRRRRLPHHIVLLHRSRQCNCPRLLRKLFERDERIASRLTLAEQFTRTDWLRIRPSKPLVGEQLALSFG
jgi:phosphoribosyl 1,2-cyclic phosphodiesterase